MNVNINLNITESASKEFKRSMAESDLQDHLVRVSVQAGGCSGFMYGLGFVEKSDIAEDDLVEKFGDVEIVVDKKSLLFLDGTTIDWVEDINQRGFKFNNPNATKSCGCGKSFQ
jgi:iron-sulfur cluster assembly accessory protein